MNVKIFKNFAINTVSIRECKILLENEFSIVFEERESLYLGVYFKSIFLNSILKLSENYCKIEDYWIEPEFKNLNVVISVSILHGKKKDRMETDCIISATLLKLNFQLVSAYEKEDK